MNRGVFSGSNKDPRRTDFQRQNQSSTPEGFNPSAWNLTRATLTEDIKKKVENKETIRIHLCSTSDISEELLQYFHSIVMPLVTEEAHNLGVQVQFFEFNFPKYSSDYQQAKRASKAVISAFTCDYFICLHNNSDKDVRITYERLDSNDSEVQDFITWANGFRHGSFATEIAAALYQTVNKKTRDRRVLFCSQQDSAYPEFRQALRSYQSIIQQDVLKLCSSVTDHIISWIRQDHKPIPYTDQYKNNSFLHLKHLATQAPDQKDFVTQIEKKFESDLPVILRTEDDAARARILLAIIEKKGLFERFVTSNTVLYLSVEATSEAVTVERCLELIAEQAKSHTSSFPKLKDKDVDSIEWKGANTLVEYLKGANVIVILDGVHLLQPSSSFPNPQHLDWLPTQLPSNVKMLITLTELLNTRKLSQVMNFSSVLVPGPNHQAIAFRIRSITKNCAPVIEDQQASDILKRAELPRGKYLPILYEIFTSSNLDAASTYEAFLLTLKLKKMLDILSLLYELWSRQYGADVVHAVLFPLAFASAGADQSIFRHMKEKLVHQNGSETMMQAFLARIRPFIVSEGTRCMFRDREVALQFMSILMRSQTERQIDAYAEYALLQGRSSDTLVDLLGIYCLKGDDAGFFKTLAQVKVVASQIFHLYERYPVQLLKAFKFLADDPLKLQIIFKDKPNWRELYAVLKILCECDHANASLIVQMFKEKSLAESAKCIALYEANNLIKRGQFMKALELLDASFADVLQLSEDLSILAVDFYNLKIMAFMKINSIDQARGIIYEALSRCLSLTNVPIESSVNTRALVCQVHYLRGEAEQADNTLGDVDPKFDPDATSVTKAHAMYHFTTALLKRKTSIEESYRSMKRANEILNSIAPNSGLHLLLRVHIVSFLVEQKRLPEAEQWLAECRTAVETPAESTFERADALRKLANLEFKMQTKNSHQITAYLKIAKSTMEAIGITDTLDYLECSLDYGYSLISYSRQQKDDPTLVQRFELKNTS
eukprot:TRINITY_DN2336_c0_g1_i6.p1 TRINITY_DN2336_c0_g1~~TRINITY_DN2336_c0_g1_i6.p1  ORF type:complete len:1003 (-),score=171.56 TRINITY_DN2336_c0_g1_i6:929-3937(-)